MSLLTIAQNVSVEAGFFSTPASIIGSSNAEANLLEVLANRSGRRLAKRFNWEKLVKIATITTAASDADYDLPTDFERFIYNTWWNNTENRRVAFASPQLWEYLQNGLVASSQLDQFYRNFGGEIQIHPTPDSVDSIKYEYVGNKWVSNSAGDTFYTTFQADTDEVLVPEELMELEMLWRLKKHFKQPYLDDRDEAERAFLEYKADDAGAEVISPKKFRRPFPNIRDGNFPAS